MIHFILKIFKGRTKKNGRLFNNINKILVVRQHNQLGDLLISSPLYRAIKEYFPNSHLTAIVSNANYKALQNNPFVDSLFVFDKSKLKETAYINEFNKILKSNYDLAIVPSATSLSFTSDLLVGLSNAKIKIGALSLDGVFNKSSYFFDYKVELDWRNKPDTHVSQRNLEILAPLGITTNNLSPIISISEKDKTEAEKFINLIPGDKTKPLICFHPGAGKIQNRWSYKNFAELINILLNEYQPRIFFSAGSFDDKEIVNKISNLTGKNFTVFDLPGMSLLAAVLEKTNLFITNDTGPMHAGASVKTPQISLFGPTDPKMWAPLGETKIYIKKDEDINSISVEDALKECDKLLKISSTD